MLDLRRNIWRVLGFGTLIGFGACSGTDGTTSGVPVCGDGVAQAPETCDDGNGSPADGCDVTCQVESGFVCDTSSGPSVCTSVCGDGIVAGHELCDGDDLAEQSCSSLGLDSGELACLAKCLFDVSGCTGVADCGNGTWEYPEQCDGADVHGASCSSLGAGSGELGCRNDCIFDLSGCSSPPACGNGKAEYGEQCDGQDLDGQSCASLGFGTGSLGCTEQCAFDPSGCSEPPVCGDGVAEGAEQCDDADLGGHSCVLLGHDGGDLACTHNCALDESSCVDCDPGLTYCDGSCVDAQVDPAHCGGCSVAPCTQDEICVAGGCVDTTQPWELVGSGPVEALDDVVAHDLATDGSSPFVAYVTAPGASPMVRVAKHSGGPNWTFLDPSPSQGASNLNAAVSIAVAAQIPHVLYSGGLGGPNVHLKARQGGSWQEIGAPGFQSACSMHWFLELALEGVTAHLTSFGAGGCALGIDYAWWDGSAWQSHPSATGFAAQLTASGNGQPSLVVTNHAYVGVPENDLASSQSLHDVRYWDPGGPGWSTLGTALDETSAQGTDEPMSLAADDQGNLYAAWSELTGAVPASHAIYAKRYDVGTQAWGALGPGQVSGAGSATLPSIAVIDAMVWIAYAEEVGSGTHRVFVQRFDGSAGIWQPVGPELNEDPGAEATVPVIVGVDSVPMVAFREGAAPTRRLIVKQVP